MKEGEKEGVSLSRPSSRSSDVASLQTFAKPPIPLHLQRIHAALSHGVKHTFS